MEKLSKVLRVAAIVCFVTIGLYFLCGAIVSPRLGLFREDARVYSEEWLLEREGFAPQAIVMPTGISLDDGEVATLTTTLPSLLEDGMYLAVNTGKSFVMSIDGVEIYCFDNSISKLPGNITKTVVIPVPLKEEYAGKNLKMEITDGKYNRSTINTAYIGTMMGIVMMMIRNFSLQFILAVLLVLVAIAIMGIFLYVGRRDNSRTPLIHLAAAVLLICLWIIFDSPLFQMIFGLYFLDGIIGFMLVTTMGYPFLSYFDAITELRYHKIYVVLKSVIVLNFLVITTFHLTGICSYDRFLVYLDLMLVVYILAMIICTVRDYLHQKNKQHKNVIIGLVALSIFSVLEIIITIINSVIPFTLDIGGLSILVGLFALFLFSTLDQIKVLNNLKYETQNALAATKAKSDFLANMSHEIRTPINAIMGMNEMILRESEKESIREYSKDIGSASENLLKIVNDILDFSKIESGKLELVCDTYDFGELIYDVVTLVNMRAEDKGLKFVIEVDENLPCKLFGDDKRVREIITNILNNAVKYTEKGHVILRITGHVEDKILLLDIQVEDSGQGIKKEDLDSIFEGFSQVNVKKNKNIEGTGLGLTITKRLIELMEGTIRVESEFGKGSTFIVQLPQKITSDEKMGNYKNHRHVSVRNERPKLLELEIPDAKILVVDDTALNLKVIRNLLSKSKANITCASSGQEMLDLIRENIYDLILLDHMMPGMDGIETLQAAKKLEGNLCANTPVVALTANAIVGAREMYLQAGFDGYLSKPIRMEELYDTLIEYIPGARNTQ